MTEIITCMEMSIFVESDENSRVMYGFRDNFGIPVEGKEKFLYQ